MRGGFLNAKRISRPRRIREVERVQAEGRGKLVVIVAILTSAAGLLFEWIGKRLT